MSDTIAWGTVEEKPSVRDKFTAAQVKRAMKRSVHPTPDGSWIVLGNASLNDAYPFYRVEQTEDGYHRCTCMEHQGGEYRRRCGHVIRVLIEKEETGWVEERGQTPAPEAAEPTPPSPPTTPATSRFDPRDGSWGEPALPEWVSGFRPHQEDAIEDILSAFERGSKVVFLDAPTGSGKTLIAEAVRRRIRGAALYACTTKTLQDQFLEDYDYAAVLKGRRNYPTQLAPFPDVTADDCTATGDRGCNWCEVRSGCAYQQAKARALSSKLAVVNTAYLLAAWNGPGTFRDRDLVILDECDLLEGSLMGFVEVNITKRKQERYGIDRPAKKTVKESWLEWVAKTLPIIQRELRLIPEDVDDIHQIRERRWLDGMLANLRLLQSDLEGDETAWVYDLQRDSIVFKPVEVKAFGEQALWSHGKRFLVMSASIISAQEMAESLGLEDDWDVVRVESTFPVANRPVHTLYAGRVSSKTYNDVVPTLGEYLRKIVQHHQGERILVHTVSYQLARDLHGYLRGIPNTRTYSNARERELLLEWMKRTPGAVVLAPSFDRGVDLPGDLCTVQVIAKVPYPYLGDEQVKQRLYGTRGGQLWYAVQTVRSLVQMTGRGVRSAQDTCVTYILDRQFSDFYNRNKRLFPEWWRAAVDTTGRVRSLIGL